jgi:hypothetical protein
MLSHSKLVSVMDAGEIWGDTRTKQGNAPRRIARNFVIAGRNAVQSAGMHRMGFGSVLPTEAGDRAKPRLINSRK